MKQSLKNIIAGFVILVFVALWLNSHIQLNGLNTTLMQYRDELSFYQLKSLADSLLNSNEDARALELFAVIDSMGSSDHYSNRAREIIEARKMDNTSYTELADKLRRRSNAIRQLLANKHELNDSLESVKSSLGTLQHENDSMRVSNRYISQKVNELSDSIGAITPMDALVLQNADGVTIRYIGGTNDGQAEGFGYAIFDSKSFYEGYWHSNQRWGTGKYHWPNGDFYEGEYANDLRNGYGIYHFSSGELYKGHWKNDLRHGHGILLSKDGKVLFRGKWKDNEPVKKTTNHLLNISLLE
ncbi:hypothetical protein KEM09_11215 [Carboxylicivirga mesophila]|uniref:MORN repeat-containing protein n=1 Tax=Carboxylicivirga mesophila TaxID=1166478 RepID=A0ABS5KAC7_9BACT|nr:hypothetical protein [Carboxylicivirga mesophila]MBS2211978.1 hypothetical protein [Carboxylicivirga mesophila]